jgi:triosephosphate isomerase (TIM)
MSIGCFFGFLEILREEFMSQKSSRPFIVAGNWKMYKTSEEALRYVETLAPLIKRSQALVYLAVPFTTIHQAVQRVKGLNAPITIGAQNMHDANEGAFTGEIAARMLIDAGAQFVILGHSERRHIFQESDPFINRKLKRALAAAIQPILCVGETLEERESGRLTEILKRQLLGGLEGISSEELSKVILAYEPVWAIGTGKVAHPKDAQEAHRLCRDTIAEGWGEKSAMSLVIQYGGSVKVENASQLISQNDVDGLLVGGASLSPEEFSQIINSYKT